MGSKGTTGTVTYTGQNPAMQAGNLSPTPSPVRKNYTTLERLGQDFRGHAVLLNTMTIVCPFMSLPVPQSVGPMRAFITDSPDPLVVVPGGMPAQGGGTITRPVWTDGITWYYG